MAVQIQAIKKCGYLRQIAQGAIDNTLTLREALVAAQKSVWLPSFQTGRILVSQSGSGQSGSFQMAGSGNEWTQDNIFGMLEEFLMLLDWSDVIVLPDVATPESTEALRAAMAIDIMAGNIPQAIRQVGIDVTLIGFPQQGTSVGY